MKRYLIVISGIVMLACLGGAHAWSVFVGPLRGTYGYSSLQGQFIFGTFVCSFCLSMLVMGRLHDRLGPRPLGIASAVLVTLSYLLAWRMGDVYPVLWLALGVLNGLASAAGYVGPIAAGVKWFPRQQGLVCGLAAAGFAGGAILLSALAEVLLRANWRVLDIFGLLALVYGPVVLLSGLMQSSPPGLAPSQYVAFHRRVLLKDQRFWMLFLGMLGGTLPYLMLMGNVKPIGQAFGLAAVAAIAIPVVAVGNATGRIVWGFVLDRLGHRSAMLGSLSLAAAGMAVVICLGRQSPTAFLVGSCVVGFCYGSCFAIYPATVARLYGPRLIGSIYGMVMVAQGISSIGPTIGGAIYDATGSFIPGLALAASITMAAYIACGLLSRELTGKRG